MKLTTLLLTCAILQVSAASFGQTLTLKRKNVTVKGLLDEIRVQTGFDVILAGNALEPGLKVHADFDKTPLRDVIRQLVKDRGLTFVIEDRSVIIKPAPVPANEAQEPPPGRIDVEGRVTDDKGSPLVGATVRIKGTAKTAASNDQGVFVLKDVDEGAVLIVSFVGYQTREVPLKPGSGKITIALAHAETQIKEVVVNTGIFRKADKSFSGNSITITAKELQSFGTRNLVTSLRNIDPSFVVIDNNQFGSDPNRMPEIQIHGNSSLPNVAQLRDQTRVNLNTPLIILDGFQSSLQMLMDINENEVESITILKDAAATAIYGSRGANGVVVITTRLPRMGKLTLNYNAGFKFEAPDLRDYNLLKSREKLELERMAGYYDYPYDPGHDVQLKRYYNYLLDEVNRGVETDWMALPLHSGLGYNHNLGIQGGDQTFRYSATVQMNTNKGVMKGADRNAFNGGINLAYTYRQFRFRNNLIIQQVKSSQSPYGSFGDYARMNPYWRAHDENGKLIKTLGDPGGDINYTDFWSTLPTNPLFNATLNTFDKTELLSIINNTSVEYRISNALNLTGNFGVHKSNTQADKFRPAEHTAFASYSAEDFFRRGDYNYGVNNTLGYEGALNLTYTQTFGSKHAVFGGLNYSVIQNSSSAYNFKAEGFTNEQFDFMSMALQYEKDAKPSGTESLSRSVGFTANANYGYDERYYLDLSFRMDGASQFGSDNRFAPFWSAGLAWNADRESFLKNSKLVTRLKFRGSVGVTGSQSFSAYQALSTYSYYTDKRYFNWLGNYLMGLGNPALKWQKATQYNAGMDAEFWSGRLNVRVDVYRNTTDGMVSSINLPASNGFSSYTSNIGSMRNQGFDMRISTFILSNPKGISWTVSGGLSKTANKILKLSQALKDAQAAIQSEVSPGMFYAEGQSSNDLYVVRTLGIDPGTGKELYLGVDGLPTYTWRAKDVVPVGSTLPDFSGNFSSMVRYKGFAINTAFRYTFGAVQYNSTLVSKVETSDYRYNVDGRVFESRWQKPGDVTFYKGLLVTETTKKTSRFVQKENTLVLSNINFMYDFRSPGVLKQLRMRSLSLGANISEPLYLSTIRRERGTSYPFSRQFSFNLNATF